jgi:hypothetical protein
MCFAGDEVTRLISKAEARRQNDEGVPGTFHVKGMFLH